MDVFEKIEAPVIMDADSPLSAALGELAKCDSCIVVTKGDAYNGILSDRSVEGVTSDPSTTKIGSVSDRAPVLDYGSELSEVCKLFLVGPYKSLPVRRGKKVIGVLRRSDALAALADAGMLAGTVGDYMTAPAIRIGDDSTIAQALAKMRDNAVRRLLVYGGGKLKGILSVYDVKVRTLVPKERTPFAQEKHSGEAALVSSIMTPGDEIEAIPPGAHLSEAASRLAEKRVSALVVEEKGEAVGIISARDILESLVSGEKTPVHLSGLDEEERLSLDALKSDIEGKLEKIARSVGVDYLALHFKHYKHKYSVHARLKTSRRGVIPVSNSGFDLRGVVHGVMGELEKIALQKIKPSPLHDKAGKREARSESGMDQE